MMHNPKADLGHVFRGQFEPVFAETKACAFCGSKDRKLQCLNIAEQSKQSCRNNEANDAQNDHIKEDRILEVAIQWIDSTGIASNLPASMRLIEHIAETAGYHRAQQPNSTNVIELMLMAARASTLADEFGQDR